jgi:hypothetical protein
MYKVPPPFVSVSMVLHYVWHSLAPIQDGYKLNEEMVLFPNMILWSPLLKNK